MSDKDKDVSVDDVVDVAADKVDNTLDAAEKTLERVKDAGSKKLDDISDAISPSEENGAGSSRWLLMLLLLLLVGAVIWVMLTKVTINPKDVEARLQSFEDTIANKVSQSGGELDIN